MAGGSFLRDSKRRAVAG